uniref:Uncharacterized protein n=1 Tax=Panagrolaimus davidi TaxID=227884 RepID=A0A914P217_9BILA
MKLFKDLLRFADKFGIPKIREIIEAKMNPKITFMNVVEIANEAIRFNAQNLRQKCFDFILDSVKNQDSLLNIEKLDKDFAFEVFLQAFYRISETVEKQFYD